MALGDIGLVPLLLMHTHTGDTRLYLSAEYAENHIGFQAILLQTIVNVATYIGEYSHMKRNTCRFRSEKVQDVLIAFLLLNGLLDDIWLAAVTTI